MSSGIATDKDNNNAVHRILQGLDIELDAKDEHILEENLKEYLEAIMGAETEKTTLIGLCKIWFKKIDEHPVSLLPIIAFLAFFFGMGAKIVSGWIINPLQTEATLLAHKIESLSDETSTLESRTNAATNLIDDKVVVAERLMSPLKTEVEQAGEALSEIKTLAKEMRDGSLSITDAAKDSQSMLREFEGRLSEIQDGYVHKVSETLAMAEKERSAIHRFLVNRIMFDLKMTMSFSPSEINSEKHETLKQLLMQNGKIAHELLDTTGGLEFKSLRQIHDTVLEYFEAFVSYPDRDEETQETKVSRVAKLLEGTLNVDHSSLAEHEQSVVDYLNFAAGSACLDLYSRLKRKGLEPRLIHLQDAVEYLSSVKGKNIQGRALTNLGVCRIKQFEERSAELLSMHKKLGYEQLTIRERADLDKILQEAINCFESNKFYQSKSNGHSVLINDLANALYMKSMVNANPDRQAGTLRRAREQLLHATRFKKPDPIVFVTLAEVESLSIGLVPPKEPTKKLEEILEYINTGVSRGYDFPYDTLDELLTSRFAGHPYQKLQVLDSDWKNKLKKATRLP